ncbi:MAG: sulfurtransferase [Candidatus Eremiobacteraeota bacterium]|nr:sulfurtransferase [Candidatus Eremiobacteraeota bacterium]MBC5803691.1 sulfurtransferase [Candidatus Eremiobacteraeota bacterium]MBC5821174.1 sulfurtransferase [Candidatus Eremiobacteraeota bacterium]
MRAGGAAPAVLDVREDEELALASFPDARHIPMDQIPARLNEVPTDRDIVVLCHSGGRSAVVAAYLRAHGFPRVANLRGGIDAWSQQIDPTVPRY